MTEFHFLRPEWLWGFAAFLLLPLLTARTGAAGGAWRAACDLFLLKKQLVSGEKRRSRAFPLFLLAVSWGLAVLALAGPAWERLPQPALKKGTDTVFLWDVSLFMSPQDVKPSRTDRARFKLYDFLKHSDGGQYALILYDSDAFVAVPLTSDVKVIENILPSVQAGIMGGGKPDLARALKQAGELLDGAKSPDGNVVVLGAFADENDSAAVTAARKLKSEGRRVSVLSVGTTQGGPVQKPDGTFLSDSRGKAFLSGISEPAFKKIAAAGGGVYRRSVPDDSDISAVFSLHSGENAGFGDLTGEMQKADAWKDAGVYVTLLILPFAAMGFRRGWLGCLLFYFFFTSGANAFSWKDAFERADRREALNISAGLPSGHPEAFGDDPRWRAAAEYKAGRYSDAVRSLSGMPDAESLYNKANALAYSGRIEEAVKTYGKVLESDPDHKDAAFNKKYLEDELKKQRQNQQRNPQQNQQREQQRQNDGRQDAAQNGQNADGGQNTPENSENAGAQEKNSSPSGGRESGREGNPEEQAGENRSGTSSGNRFAGEEEGETAENRRENGRNAQSGEEGRAASQQAAAEAERQAEKERQAERERRARAGTDGDGRDEKEEKEGKPSGGSAKDEPEDPEKQRRKEWLSVIEDDPSGVLRERIRRRNARKRRMW